MSTYGPEDFERFGLTSPKGIHEGVKYMHSSGQGLLPSLVSGGD